MAKQLNKLVEILAKAEYAVGMTDQAKESVHHPGGLWYHAIGMFNSFYAINEEIKIRLKNGNDLELKAATEDWWKANERAVKGFFGSARNVATHQGAIQCEYFTSWEIDHWNNTDQPVRSAKVTVEGSNIKEMPAIEFLTLCSSALIFMRDGILAIDADYKARGGGKHALPEPEHLGKMFRDFEL